MIPGVKSLLYIGKFTGSLTSKCQGREIDCQRSDQKKKRERGGGLNVIYPGICHKLY